MINNKINLTDSDEETVDASHPLPGADVGSETAMEKNQIDEKSSIINTFDI